MSSVYVVPISQVRFELQCLGLGSADEFTAWFCSEICSKIFFWGHPKDVTESLCFCLAPGKNSKGLVFFLILINFWLRWVFVSACRLSPVAELRVLAAVASLVAIHGLSIPDQGSNPCLLHWQVNSIHWTTREARKISLLIVMMSLTLRSQDAAEETKKSEVNGLEVEFGVRASPQFRSQLPDNLAKADPSPRHSVTQKLH